MSLDQVGRAAGDQLRRTTRESVDPMARLDELHRLRASRSRAWLGVSSMLVLAIASLGWLVLLPTGSSSSPPAAPTTIPSPTASVERPRAPRLLPPLCGPDRYDIVGTPAGQSRECPTDLAAGRYRSAILGLHAARAFTVTLPSGWGATRLEQNAGVDFAGGATGPGAAPSGVTVLAYPEPVGSKSPGVWSPTKLRAWLSEQPTLRLSGARTTRLDGFSVWQVDVRAAPGATLSTHCRLVPRCLPVFDAQMAAIALRSQVPVVELTPGTTSRLLLMDMRGDQVPAAVWVWNTAGSPGQQALDVARSLTFEPARDPVAFHG